MTLHFLNDVVNDIELTQKSIRMIIITSSNSESACKLIKRIPGSHFFSSPERKAKGELIVMGLCPSSVRPSCLRKLFL